MSSNMQAAMRKTQGLANESCIAWRSIGSWLCLFVTLGVFAAPFARADDASTKAPRYYIPTLPTKGESLDIYLLTGGLGGDVANRYGHTAIRIVDHEAETDVVFNWGTYSFENFGFLWDFFRGSLIYTMGVRAMYQDVFFYDREGRRLTQDRLNLSPKQKLALLTKIRWNAHPENRKFPYQYWYMNCATIPRDYLNELLGGEPYRRLAHAPTGKVFRDYVRSHLGGVPFVAPGLDVFMNSNIDRPISAWEEMFVPAGLREHLLTLPAVGDDGVVIEGSHLLTETKVLLDHPEYLGRPFNDYFALGALYGVPLLAGWVLLLASRKRASLRAYAFRALGAASMVWGFIGGSMGTVLVLNWLFSGHPDAWHNVNLGFFMPLDWWYVVYGLALWRERGPVKDRWPWPRAGLALTLVHLVSAALVILMTALGVLTQDIWQVAGWLGLPALALQLTVSVVSWQRAPRLMPRKGAVDAKASAAASADVTARRVTHQA